MTYDEKKLDDMMDEIETHIIEKLHKCVLEEKLSIHDLSYLTKAFAKLEIAREHNPHLHHGHTLNKY